MPPVCRDGPGAAGRGHRQLHQQGHARASAAQMRDRCGPTGGGADESRSDSYGLDKPKTDFVTFCQNKIF